jgi:hypothetical protein
LRWWPYKLAFVALVLLPFLPAIAISEIPALARVGRCFFGEGACLTGTITTAPRAASRSAAAFIISIAAGWLVVCYLILSLGWRTRIMSRLLLAFAVTLIFAFLPNLMPLRELGITNDSGRILLIQVWLTFIGFPIGYTAFLFYVIFSGIGTEP